MIKDSLSLVFHRNQDHHNVMKDYQSRLHVRLIVDALLVANSYTEMCSISWWLLMYTHDARPMYAPVVAHPSFHVVEFKCFNTTQASFTYFTINREDTYSFAWRHNQLPFRPRNTLTVNMTLRDGIHWYDMTLLSLVLPILYRKKGQVRSVHHFSAAMLFGWEQSAETERRIPATDGK